MQHTDPSPLADADLVVATLSPDAKSVITSVASLGVTELITASPAVAVTGDALIDRRLRAVADEVAHRHVFLGEPQRQLREADPSLVHLLARQAEQAQRALPMVEKAVEAAKIAVMYFGADAGVFLAGGRNAGGPLTAGVAGTVAGAAMLVDGAVTYATIAQASGSTVFADAGLGAPWAIEVNAVALTVGAMLAGAGLAAILDRGLNKLGAQKYGPAIAGIGLVGVAAALASLRTAAGQEPGDGHVALAVLVLLSCIALPLVAAAALRTLRSALSRGQAATTDPATVAFNAYDGAIERMARLEADFARPALVEVAFGELVASGVLAARERLARAHRRTAATLLLHELLKLVPPAHRELLAYLARKVVKSETRR